MKVTLNLTECFNCVVNSDCIFDLTSEKMKPVLFFDPEGLAGNTLTVRMMNFQLNYREEMEAQYRHYDPVFQELLACDPKECMGLYIYGMAELHLTKVKGIDMLFRPEEDSFQPETYRYYTQHSCKIKAGDELFTMGGFSVYSGHYINMHVITGPEASAETTFSPEETVVVKEASETEEHRIAAYTAPVPCLTSRTADAFMHKLTPETAKTYDIDFLNHHFHHDLHSGHLLREIADFEE